LDPTLVAEDVKVSGKGNIDDHIAIDVLELSDQVHQFAWEPHGTRFAIAHSSLANPAAKCDISFYEVKNHKIELQKKLENKQVSGLYWSPTGAYMLIAAIPGGALEFIDTSNYSTTATHDHFQCSEVEWDPSGRYVVSSAVQQIGESAVSFKVTVDNGYRLFTMQGRELCKMGVEHLFQFGWRLRPPSLLSKEQRDEKYLKEKYWKTFEAHDEKLRQESLVGVAKERLRLKEDWKAIRAAHLKDYNDTAVMRADLRDGILSDEEEDFDEVETIVEEEISRTVEILSPTTASTPTTVTATLPAAGTQIGERTGRKIRGV